MLSDTGSSIQYVLGCQKAITFSLRQLDYISVV